MNRTGSGPTDAESAADLEHATQLFEIFGDKDMLGFSALHRRSATWNRARCTFAASVERMSHEDFSRKRSQAAWLLVRRADRGADVQRAAVILDSARAVD